MSNKGVELQKSLNVKQILQIIRHSKSVKKTLIKDLSGLSFATVSSISNELVAKNVLQEESSINHQPGRTPKSFSIKRNAYFAICLDMQSLGYVDVYIQDICNQTVYYEKVLYDNPLEIDRIISNIYQVVTRETERLQISNSQFIGVGASVSAVFDCIRKQFNPALLHSGKAWI